MPRESFEQDFESGITTQMLSLARAIAISDSCGTDEVSPFCLEALYRSAVIYARRHKASGEHSDMDAVITIKEALRILSPRWKLAGKSRLGFSHFLQIRTKIF